MPSATGRPQNRRRRSPFVWICVDTRLVPICGPFCVRPDMWSDLSPVSTITSFLPVLSKQNYQHHCPFQSSISFSSALASQTGPEFDFWFKSVTFTKPSTPRLCFVPKPQQQEACPCSAFVLSFYSLHGVVLPAPCSLCTTPCLAPCSLPPATPCLPSSLPAQYQSLPFLKITTKATTLLCSLLRNRYKG